MKIEITVNNNNCFLNLLKFMKNPRNCLSRLQIALNQCKPSFCFCLICWAHTLNMMDDFYKKSSTGLFEPGVAFNQFPGATFP